MNTLDHAELTGMLDRLKLTAIRDQLDTLLDEAARSEMTLREALGFLVSREIARRDERRISMASKIAQFPFVRELEGFDWSAQPSLDPRQIRELATCRWIAHGDTTLLMGPPGTGKTHLAVALGREAIRQNYSVQFVTAATLVATLAKVHADGALHPRGDGPHRQGREPGRAPDHATPQAGDPKPREAAGAIAPSAMVRPVLELADIFREHGPAWREANRGHASLDQLKVMSAIERCRTAALGGHVARCENPACGHTHVAYNSCRDRHCPKCQAAASRRWLADREAELLPVPYFHVVYTLPGKLRDIAWQNKRVVYDLLMKAAAETTLAIAANPRRLGARIGVTAVLHTWGSTLTHHPHVHMIVPGGGLSPDGSHSVASRSNFLVHVTLLARLFSGRMLAMLVDAHGAGRLTFFNAHSRLADKTTFKRFIAPLRRAKWVVYCKAPFAGPKQVLRYLSRYTHRVAISNRRLVAADHAGVAFRWKDYRIDGPGRWKSMWLHPHEFIRRFLLHVLPKGFHRIRHYGLLANANRAANIAKARALLGADPPTADPEQPETTPDAPPVAPCPCPRCGARMVVIEVFARGCQPGWRPTPSGFDTS